MPFFVDGGFQVARGDPSTKFGVLSLPSFCVLCLPPLPSAALGVFVVSFRLVAGARSFVVLNEIPAYFMSIKNESPGIRIPGILARYHAHCFIQQRRLANFPPGEFMPSSSLSTMRRLLSWARDSDIYIS